MKIGRNVDQPVEMTASIDLHRHTSNRDQWSICYQLNSNKLYLQVTTAKSYQKFIHMAYCIVDANLLISIMTLIESNRSLTPNGACQ